MVGENSMFGSFDRPHPGRSWCSRSRIRELYMPTGRPLFEVAQITQPAWSFFMSSCFRGDPGGTDSPGHATSCALSCPAVARPVQVARVIVPQAAQSLRNRQSGIHMLDLKSFHIVLLAASIVLMSGFGMWGLLNDYQLLGAISMAIAVLLVGYFAYFAVGARRVEH